MEAVAVKLAAEPSAEPQVASEAQPIQVAAGESVTVTITDDNTDAYVDQIQVDFVSSSSSSSTAEVVVTDAEGQEV